MVQYSRMVRAFNMMKYACVLVMVSIIACSPATDSRSSDDGISSIPDGQLVVVNCQNASGTGWVYVFEVGSIVADSSLVLSGDLVETATKMDAAWAKNKVYLSDSNAPIGQLEVMIDRRTLFATRNYESDRENQSQKCKLEGVGRQF
jgi:hypothetical protein